MRFAVLAATLLFLAPESLAQRAPASASPRAAVVVPALPGEAVRITTSRRAPSNRERLRQYRGIRVYRPAPAGVQVAPAQPVLPTVYTASGERFVRRGGSYFYAGTR